MTTACRLVAIAIAVAALWDPAITRSMQTSLPVEVVLPPASDPGYAAAVVTSGALERDLTGVATTQSAEPAAARILIGAAPTPLDHRPVFVLEPPAAAGVRIESAGTRGATVPGQEIRVDVALRGTGVEGRRSTVTLLDRGIVLSRVEHDWTAGQPHHTMTLSAPSSSNGVQRLEVRVTTAGAADASWDVAAVVQERPLRVLIYEPRPSWPVTFIRRVLERQPAFTVSALSMTAPRSSTRLGSAPGALPGLDPSACDLIVVGAADALTAADLNRLDTFVGKRGGSLLLVPDRRLPDPVQRRFTLPPADELLAQSPLAIEVPSGRMRATEILMAKDLTSAVTSLASVTHNGAARPVVVLREHGEGRVVLSGLLDAWRYRDASSDHFWRGLAADLALDAAPRLAVRIEPALARPGDRVAVTAQWRPDQLTGATDVHVPPTSASITSASGQRQPIRLWPGEHAGIYEAVIDAPGPGTYTISVAGEDVRVDELLRVEDGVVHGSTRGPDKLAALASLTGGAVVRSTADLRTALARIGAGDQEEEIYPMRSPVWILLFAAALLAEWLIRRRRGLR